jgi:hypothetical protein
MSIGMYLAAMVTVLREPPLGSVRVKVEGLSRQVSRNSFMSMVTAAMTSSRVSFSALVAGQSAAVGAEESDWAHVLSLRTMWL